jgi:hypothetical protein
MDEHQADPARVGSTDEGMVIGSATDPSSLRSFVREGVAHEDERVCAPANGIPSGSDRISAPAAETAPGVDDYVDPPMQQYVLCRSCDKP